MTRDEIDDLMRDNGIVVVGEAVYALVQLVIDSEREECAKLVEEHIVPEIANEMARIIRSSGNA